MSHSDIKGKGKKEKKKKTVAFCSCPEDLSETYFVWQMKFQDNKTSKL